MSYYDDDDDDDFVVELGYRDAVRVRDQRRRTGRPSGHRGFQRRHESRRPQSVTVVRGNNGRQPAVVREPVYEPVVVDGQPRMIQPIRGGINLDGISLATLGGVVLTLGGLGVQLASHFVNKPKPPKDDAELEDVTAYQRKQSDAERKTHILETVGRSLSDLGQLAAFRKGD